MTISRDTAIVRTLQSMKMGLSEACVNYMTPLGLHHIMQVDFHYSPGPQHNEGREDWGSTYYHRAVSIELGFDRSSTGSNAASQYFSPWREKFDIFNTCPEKYILWFHHVQWDYTMKSGKTLWVELCTKFYSGTKFVDGMLVSWSSLVKSIDPEIHSLVKARLEKQKTDAAIWRDTCLSYFQNFSKKPIVNTYSNNLR